MPLERYFFNRYFYSEILRLHFVPLRMTTNGLDSSTSLRLTEKDKYINIWIASFLAMTTIEWRFLRYGRNDVTSGLLRIRSQ